MPRDVELFFALTEKPQKGVKKEKLRSVLDLSKKCSIHPNWMTDKQGNCHKIMCENFKKPGCPARRNV